MRKYILTVFLFLGLSVSFAQEAKFSFEPKPFHNTILLSTKLEQTQDIKVQFINESNDVVEEKTYSNINTSRFKINVTNLVAGKDYTVKVFSNNGDLLYSEKLHKSINAK